MITITSALTVSVLLIQNSVADFAESKTKTSIEDRSAELSEAFFPSVSVCNANHVRKSFVYWLMEGLAKEGRNVTQSVLYHWIRGNINGDHMDDNEHALQNIVFDSNFYSTEFQQMLKELKDSKSSNKNFSESVFFP